MSRRAEPTPSGARAAVHGRLARPFVQEADVLELRSCLGEGLARRAVREPEAPGRVRDAFGGDSAGAGSSAVRRAALRALGATRAWQAVRLPDRSGRAGSVVARHVEALEAATQRGAERGEAEARRCLPLLLRAWEPQKRGAAHVHPVFSVPTPATSCSLRHTSTSSRGWLRVTASASSVRSGRESAGDGGERAAAYLSSYFVTGKRRRRRSPRTRGTRTCHGC